MSSSATAKTTRPRRRSRVRRRSELRALTPLLRAAELADAGTGRHLDRVATYAAKASRGLGLDESTASSIASACRLHDIGKLAVPTEILRKPGPLSTAERRVMERHTAAGHAILANAGSPLLDLAAEIALTHHEWVDGRGYPGAMQGDEIPLAGRIAAVADAFDALTSDRVYRPAFSKDAAARILRRAAGSQFDPAVVDAFLAAIGIAETPDDAPERPSNRGSARRQRDTAPERSARRFFGAERR